MGIRIVPTIGITFDLKVKFSRTTLSLNLQVKMENTIIKPTKPMLIIFRDKSVARGCAMYVDEPIIMLKIVFLRRLMSINQGSPISKEIKVIILK